MSNNEGGVPIEQELIAETAKLVGEGEGDKVTQEMIDNPFYATLKEALKKDAKHHVDKGTMKLPVDPEEFASRLEGGPLMKAVALQHEDYVRAIKEVCDELGIERVH